MGSDLAGWKFPAESTPVSVLVCLECDSTVGVQMESARTVYHFEGEVGSVDDPNRPIPLCRGCARNHHDYWDSMWADYYGGLL